MKWVLTELTFVFPVTLLGFLAGIYVHTANTRTATSVFTTGDVGRRDSFVCSRAHYRCGPSNVTFDSQRPTLNSIMNNERKFSGPYLAEIAVAIAIVLLITAKWGS